MQAGDAIFIPEGWWHQIDSAANTIAVNLWWRSAFDKQLGSHMDSYYLTRTLQSLTEKQKATLLSREVPLEEMGLSQSTVERLRRAAGMKDKEVIQSATWALAKSEDRPAWKRQRVEEDGKQDQQGTQSGFMTTQNPRRSHAATCCSFLTEHALQCRSWCESDVSAHERWKC